METEREIVDLFKQTSIRGRLAFGASCVQRFAEQYEIHDDWIDKLISVLWEFTTSRQLDMWEKKVRDLWPELILESSHKNTYMDYPSLTKSDFVELKDLYSNLPQAFVEMINNTIEIGVGNLFYGTGNFSESTLYYTLKVFQEATSMLLNIPDPHIFSVSKFSESGGWGEPIGRDKFATDFDQP